MRTIADRLQKDDVLADGGRVISTTPIDHDTYVSVVVRYANREVRIRDFDKGFSLDVGRPLRNPFAEIGPGYERDIDDRAADAYERQRGF